MQVSTVSSARAASTSSTDGSTSSGSTTSTTNKKNTLGQEDFLKLLAVQFQSQDPMNPMEDTAFIAQMAQFTALDQSSSMLTQITALNTKQDQVTANSYIGRQVTFDNGDDTTATGVVSGVENTSGTPRLIVGDVTYPLSAVLLVEPAPTSTTTTDETVTTGN